MLLTDIKLHLQLNGQCSLWDLCCRFQKEPEIMRSLLQVWMDKGKISYQKNHNSGPNNKHCRQTGSLCSDCQMCATAVDTFLHRQPRKIFPQDEIYEWV